MSAYIDEAYMATALGLARRHVGWTCPNPSVGCVLVKQNRIIARAVTAKGGRPHAETIALEAAGEAARGATAYVSLEPCVHHGVTGPCTEALITAGVARVVIACFDPDPRVSGKGAQRLQQAGVAVEVGVLAEEAREVNEGFFCRIEKGRPLVTLKLASTADGRIATSAGESQWISCAEAREYAHLLRAQNDAIAVGINTALADDPMLTCRLPGMEDRSPVRVIFDRRLRLPLTSKLVQTAKDIPLWLLILPDQDPHRRAAFAEAGVELIEIPEAETGHYATTDALHELGRRGITRLIVEGGARLAASMIKQDAVDRIEWVKAPMILGSDALPAIAELGVEELVEAARYCLTHSRRLGCDVLDILTRKARG